MTLGALHNVRFSNLWPFALTALLFPLVWWQLLGIWFDAEQVNVHALPAILAALFIALTSTLRLKQQPALFARTLPLIFMLFLCGSYVVFQLVNITVVNYLLVVAAIGLLFITLYGLKPFSTLFAIFVLLMLALPLWDALLEPLVVLASIVVTSFVNLFSITVLIEGNSITTPYGRILIAEGCSGIRYLLITIVFSLLLSHMNRYSFKQTLLALLAGAFLGLFANWIRITLLIFIGYYSKMESSLMTDHEFFGWVVYGVVILPAFYYAPAAKQAVKHSIRNTGRLDKGLLIGLVFLGIATAGTLLLMQSQFTSSTNQTVALNNNWLPLNSRPRNLPDIPSSLTDALQFQHRHSESYVVTLSHSKNSSRDKLVPYIPQSNVSNSWFLEGTQNINVNGTNYPVSVFKSLNSETRFIRLQLFSVGGFTTSSYAEAKLLQVPALLLGKNQFHYLLIDYRCQRNLCDSNFSPFTLLLTEDIFNGSF